MVEIGNAELKPLTLASTDGNPWASERYASGQWLRGNLHCHTTQSDGRLTPQETVDWFSSAGYQFLAITDHNTITDPSILDPRGMCLIPSTELTAAGGEFGTSYHLIGLGVPAESPLPPVTSAASDSVRWLRDQGGVVFVAHPHWSGLTVGDLVRAGAHGIEIYNGGTVLDSQKGEALIYWEQGLAYNERWWGIAVDDTHWHTIDRGLGWVMVRASEATPQSILAALAQGHFYASSGPEIRRVSVTPRDQGGAYIEVEASPCAAIYLLGYGSRNQFHFDREAAARGEAGATITLASFQVTTLGPGGFVRVQCTDWQRRSAWSNPIFLH